MISYILFSTVYAHMQMYHYTNILNTNTTETLVPSITH